MIYANPAMAGGPAVPVVQPANMMDNNMRLPQGAMFVPFSFTPVGATPEAPNMQPAQQQQLFQYPVQQPPKIQPSNQVMMTPQLPTDCPGTMVCPRCQQTVLTKVKFKVGLLVWLLFLLLLLFFPFSLIPFGVKSCKDVEHSCPNCGQVLYTYKRG